MDDGKKPAKGILKQSSSFDKQEKAQKRNKNTKWDEMNIIATFHPANKDYGHMKVEEPKTPYNWDIAESDEVDGESKAGALDPSVLHDKLSNVAAPSRRRSTPSVSESEGDDDDDDEANIDEAERARRREFKNRRKTHYNEFRVVQLARRLIEEENDDMDDDGETPSTSQAMVTSQDDS